MVQDTSFSIVTKNNGTLTANFKTGGPNNITRGQTTTFEFDIDTDFDTLRQYGDWAGSYATQTLLDGTVKYRSQIPDDASVDSLVLGIEPSADLKTAGMLGVWGLVSSADDTRNTALSRDRYSIELLVLAEYSEYADHTELENDLQL